MYTRKEYERIKEKQKKTLEKMENISGEIRCLHGK